MRKPTNYIVGVEIIKEIECSPKEFKIELDKLKKQGVQVNSIQTEPSKYNYKIKYCENRTNFEGEEWRDIPGEFFGLYQISSLGRVRTIRTKVLAEGKSNILTNNQKERKTVRIKKIMKQVFG